MAMEVSPPPSAGKRKAVDELAPDGGELLPTKEEAGEVEQTVEEVGGEDDLDPDEEILLVTIPSANIVGLKHYRGLATLKQNQGVELRRDNLNVYDSNAIEVRHLNKGQRIGSLSKTLASRVAPLLDQRIVTTKCVAGPVPVNTVAVESIPFSLSLYGPRSLLKDSRLDTFFPARAKAAAEKKRFEAELLKASKIQERRGEPRLNDSLMAESILIEKADRPTGDLLGELFKEGVADPALLPDHPSPPGKKDKTMRSDLMPFQRQGLAWMINMEHPTLPVDVDSPPVQLWVKKLDLQGETFYFNIATEDTQRDKPLLKRGGILADEMGLGKTMQTIALICTDDTGDGVLPKPEEPDERFDDMTLIVCPLSVTSNWTDQFHHHVGSKRLKWHVYHGEGREITKKQLRKFDVVITTYQTLALEHLVEIKETEKHSIKKPKVAKPVEGTLHAIKWRRVVLDEGHVIKNPKAKMSIACADLKAERRWILTGTPIINSTTDLGAMMTFLKLCRPLDQRAMWTEYVENRVKEDGPDGAKLLRAIVSSTTLRRTKDMTDTTGKRLVSLPEINFYLHRVKLSPEAQGLYDEVLGVLQGIIKGFLKKGTASAQYSNVLVYLLRLRQLACDPMLCPQSFIDDVRASRLASDREAELTPRNGVPSPAEISRLQDTLRRMTQEANAECGLCFDVPIEPRITVCGHLFCAGCIEEHIDQSGTCPMDLRELDRTQLVEPGPSREGSSDEDEVLAWQAKAGNDALSSAAKTQQLLMLLQATEPGIKSLVFSQWTTHLNCIEAALQRAGIPSCRFDGSMTQAKREGVIAEFSESKKSKKTGGKTPPVVMLISLKAGALGLNLTCASQVFLMDPWWQASIEAQAIDRVYRIGQTRPVKVFQLVAEGSVEDRVLEIQKKKEALISQAPQAFSGNKLAGPRKEKIESRLSDIASIFGMACQVADWKRHKTLCNSVRRVDLRLERDALSHPLRRQLNSGFNEFTNNHSFRNAITPALYIAFKLHRTRILNESHGLRLDFDFNPRPKKLHEQFILRTATLLTHAELARGYNSAEAHDPAFIPISASVFTTAFTNSHDPAVAQFDPSILRLPAIINAHFDPDVGKPYPHAEYSLFSRHTFIIPELRPDKIVELQKLIPLEIIPPADYDWVGALRERLRGGNKNSMEFMSRRAAAREQEKKELYERLPQAEPDYLQCAWEWGMKWRDRFDWNLGE